METTPEMEQLRSELNEYTEGGAARLKSSPLDPNASLAWSYGWSDVDKFLSRPMGHPFLRTA